MRSYFSAPVQYSWCAYHPSAFKRSMEKTGVCTLRKKGGDRREAPDNWLGFHSFMQISLKCSMGKHALSEVVRFPFKTLSRAVPVFTRWYVQNFLQNDPNLWFMSKWLPYVKNFGFYSLSSSFKCIRKTSLVLGKTTFPIERISFG